MEWEAKPGETPLHDMSGLKLRIASPTRAQIEKFEAFNINRAEEKYFIRRVTPRNAPFDLPWLKKLHREMFGDVWAWAGEFRATNLSIGVDKRWAQMALLHLLDDARAWTGMGLPVLDQAVRLHHRAVQIHPFVNGNGRWARMLSNIWLRKNKAGVVLWPTTAEAVSPIRDEYIAALKAADGMDEGPLLALHRRYWSR
jgi:Fic-DOC domain mobile mystery protein B